MAIKLLIAFVTLMIYIKVSGTGQLAPLTASDQVGNMVLGGLIGSTVVNREISPWNSTLIVLMWAILQVLIRYMKLKYPNFSQFLDGKKRPLIKDSEFVPQNFKKTKMSVSDLLLLLHQKEMNDLTEVRNVWLDSSGEITIDTINDPNQSILLIENGVIIENNLQRSQKTKEWLLKQLPCELNEVFCAFFYDGELTIHTV